MTTTPNARRAVVHDSVCDALIGQVREQGYGVLVGGLSPAEVAEINAEALRVCRGELGPLAIDGDGPPGAAPETRPHASDSDADALRRYLCIHHPHKISAVMHHVLAHPSIVDVLTGVIGPNVKAMQSMLFIKSEGMPGQAWHQDEYFIPTRDRSLNAAWIALDDATVDNGCLWVLPGSQARGVIYPDRDHDDERFDCAIEAYGFPYLDSDAVPVEVPAGSIVFFNGYLLHRSLPNSSERGLRRALVQHYMSAESLLPWRPPAEGEHMAKVDDRDIVLVAGQDPYEWKGLEDHHRPHVRPDRSGGCDR
jgi:ectoine hydroxylase-related dioxygenase (phytanoyl-CoA dioxygenase family)